MVKTSRLIHKGKRFLQLFLLVFSIWFCILTNKARLDGPQADMADQADDLSRIRKELQEKRRWLEKLGQKERSAFAELLEIEERLELTARIIQRLALKERSIERELKVEGKNLRKTDSRLYWHREYLFQRLRQTYKHSRFGPGAMIFGTTSSFDLISKLKLIQRILGKEKDLLRETESLKVGLEEKKQNLDRVKTELARVSKGKFEEQRIYQRGLEEKERLLRKIKSEKRLHTQLIEMLEQDALTIPQILDHFQRDSTHDKAAEPENKSWFQSLRGKLPWPIEGRVIFAFGEKTHPRFHTKTKNSGIEIETKTGTGVAAVAQGRVIYVSRLRGYGNLVILEHEGEYYTIYAGLSKVLVAPGEEVERLQEIGVVGEDESFSVPCLYFEIRKGKKSQDPLEWLR